ncbi:hypothetical protein L0668_14825 [Paraglaciecola aquimarina]|uniref:Lipoprotein n=1 Tax=Paraglaciecola algarum TaxID=3050085 RepID=A0ABS9DCN2_9ALTE|nr:hypothetical protein [Paraglaciecola sp. G1-23]MCF2949391.1 hypothetical protein [Paraglaciecola sp. G1-23]
MKIIMMFLSAVILLSGCAAKPEYREAKNGSVGYSEQKISDDRFRIQFKSRSKSVADAYDYALLRAAELTKQQEFDWFVVSSKETFVESEKVPASEIHLARHQYIERRCGLLTCETSARPSNQIGASLQLGTGDSRKEVHTIIEVRMGRGVKLNEDALQAQDVIDNLKTKVDKA